jgi:TolB-like protein
VTFVPAKYVAWAILLAALIISAAIIGNGERDRRFRRNHPLAAPAARVNPPVAARSVAVLPFQDLTGNGANSLYVDGVQQDLIAQLAKISDLKVVDLDPRKERQAAYSSASELGRELGVTYLIRGTVQRTANHVKLRAKLIWAEADQTLWTETYEFEISDPFSLDPEVAQKIAEQLRKRIGSHDSFAVLSRNG